MQKNNKCVKWLVSLLPFLPLIIGILFLFLGWIIDEIIQLSQYNNEMQIIKEIITPNITYEKEYSVIENLLRPSTFRLSRFVFSILSFFFGILFTNTIVESIKRLHKGGNEDIRNNSNIFDIDSTEDFIASFLDHLSEECFSKCSNVYAKCSTCEKFPNNCDGLLRNYLFHEASDLRDAIRNAKKGEYFLATNIEKYHTIAIEHLIALKSNHYKVIQMVGSKEAKDATYDSLDFDFLNSLLSKITENEPNGNTPYYKKQRFKIIWLLIGDNKNLKNNFDYIIYIVKTKKLISVVNKFFEFYAMTEDDFRTNCAPLKATENDFIKEKLNIDEKYYKPSFGIFGLHFIFEDASNVNQHGTIYTKTYKPDGDTSDENQIDKLNNIYDKIIQKAKKVAIDEFFTLYDNIISNDDSWEDTLEKRWHPEKTSA